MLILWRKDNATNEQTQRKKATILIHISFENMLKIPWMAFCNFIKFSFDLIWFFSVVFSSLSLVRMIICTPDELRRSRAQRKKKFTYRNMFWLHIYFYFQRSLVAQFYPYNFFPRILCDRLSDISLKFFFSNCNVPLNVTTTGAKKCTSGILKNPTTTNHSNSLKTNT